MNPQGSDTATATFTSRGKLAFFRTSTGATLYYEWWRPVLPKAVLVVVHGIGEHSGRYGPFIRHFFQQGYAIALYDQRGHGQSLGPRGHIEHIQDLLGDLADFVEFTRRGFPHIPLILVGHSFGGQLALNFAVRYSKGLRGLVLSSPNIGLKLEIPRWRMWLGEVLHRWLPRVRFGQQIASAVLSRDPAIVETYDHDPRVVRDFTIHAVFQMLRNLDVVMALAPRIHLPALFLHAGDDQICDPEATRQFFRRIPVARKRLKVYEGFYHELFNDVGKERVFDDITYWLQELLREERQPRTACDAPQPVARITSGLGEAPWSGHAV